MLPAIFGLEGTELTDTERSFFREVSPFGYILLVAMSLTAHNCNRSQSHFETFTVGLFPF